ncbi:MAG: hypothetical protein ACK4K9_07885 [Bacteroidia bacterium]
MNSQTFNNYLLAIIPPEPVLSDAMKLKDSIKNNLVFDGQFSLPPYIKIMKMFEWNDKEEYMLVHYLKNIIPVCNSLNIELSGLGICKNKNEIFIEVANKKEVNSINETFYKYFFAHYFSSQQIELNAETTNLIIGNGDLRSNSLTKAWNVLIDKNFYGEFIADKICLYMEVAGTWQKKYCFDLE